jgi:hypothetical protein
MAKIGDAEKIVQNHVISLFRDADVLGYKYYGNRRTCENSNIETEVLKTFLQKQGYSKTLSDRAVEELRKESKNFRSGLYAANKLV